MLEKWQQKHCNTFNEYLRYIAKDLNQQKKITFENEESCKKIKENFGNEISFFWNCF